MNLIIARADDMQSARLTDGRNHVTGGEGRIVGWTGRKRSDCYRKVDAVFLLDYRQFGRNRLITVAKTATWDQLAQTEKPRRIILLPWQPGYGPIFPNRSR